jgi:hypothetical protein
MSLFKRMTPALALALAACSSPGAPDTDTNPPPTDAPCRAADATGIEVAPSDIYGGTPYALGYPPYAIDGCLLAYVSAPGAAAGAGALLLRDLESGEESVLAPSIEAPRRPALAGEIVAWEATIGDRRVVRVRSGGAAVTTIEGPFESAGEPRAAEDAVVFTGWLTAEDTGDADVFLYTPQTGEVIPIAAGPGQQRFADISKSHVALTDFAEDPDGQFNENSTDVADIAIYDRRTGAISTRPRAGKQAFPLLGADGRVAYLAWGPDHPEPKFSQYELRAADIASPDGADISIASITTLIPYIRPTARGELVEWVDWPTVGQAELFRRSIDASAPAAAVPGVGGGGELFGPSASMSMTVLATREAGGAMILRAIERPAL